MNTEKYCQVFIHHAIPTTKHLIGNSIHFQHDNDANHTAGAVAAYLDRKTLLVMDWPPQSLKEAWRTFPEDYLKKLQKTALPSACFVVHFIFILQ